jgi:hypothetical protein
MSSYAPIMFIFPILLQLAKVKDGKKKNKKAKKFDEDAGSLSFVVPVHRHGRFVSAPTPPPYQSSVSVC